MVEDESYDGNIEVWYGVDHCVFIYFCCFSMCKSSSQTPGSSPYAQTTPIHNTVGSEDTAAAATAMVGVAGCQTVDETHQWLVENRFGQYCSLFANYTSLDLLRLSRRDLIQLCGHADGIRLFNSLRTTTLKTIYVLLPGEKGQRHLLIVTL